MIAIPKRSWEDCSFSGPYSPPELSQNLKDAEVFKEPEHLLATPPPPPPPGLSQNLKDAGVFKPPPPRAAPPPPPRPSLSRAHTPLQPVLCPMSRAQGFWEAFRPGLQTEARPGRVEQSGVNPDTNQNQQCLSLRHGNSVIHPTDSLYVGMWPREARSA